MGKIIALETEVLIIAAGGESGLERAQERALQMINHHAGRGDDIYIPAPAFAECCHSIEPDVLSLLRVVTFGVPAALLANRITPKMHKASREQESKSSRPTRQNIKVDAMILACAEVAGADVLYVGQDDWFAKTEEALRGTSDELSVSVRELPPFEPEDRSLFSED